LFENTENVVKLLARIVKTAEVLRRLGITETELDHLHRSGTQFGIMSAFMDEYSRNENKQRHTELLQYLNSRGYTWDGVKGSWPSDKKPTGYALESSVIIHNIAYDELITLGDYYNQESVIFKETNELLGMYNLWNNYVIVWFPEKTKWDMEAPRPKKREELGLEHQYSTRWRDVELLYGFDEGIKIPLDRSKPVSTEEYFSYKDQENGNDI